MRSEQALPNFFIIGAAKCGTTSLYHYMRQHPSVYLPRIKEPHFFDNDTFWRQGVGFYAKTYFSKAKGFPAIGEATPGYFHRWEKVIPRMKEVYRDCPLPVFILVLRDPVERAFSHFLHRVRNRMESESFGDALELETKRLHSDPDCWCGYFRDGLYAEQLERWFDAFGPDRFHVLLTEDLKERPLETLAEVFGFLGVDPQVPVDISAKENVASEPRWPWLMDFLGRPSIVKRPVGMALSPGFKRRIRGWMRKFNLKKATSRPVLDPALAAKLRIAYREDILKLGRMINRDLSPWLTGTGGL